MAFTGYKIFQQLQLRYKGSKELVYPPVIKNNVIGDPDYIAPVWAPEECRDATTNPQQTTSTSSSTSTSTTTAPPPVDCNTLVLQYGYDCSSPTLNTVTFILGAAGVNVNSINIEVHLNNNIIDVKENVPVIGGKASFTVPKSALGDVIFVVRGGTCRQEFPAFLDCPASTTTSTTSTTTTTTTTSTTTTSTTSTSTSTTSTTSTSTTSTSTTSTSTTSTSTSSTTSSTSTTTLSSCTATWGVLQTTPCGDDGLYAVMIEQTGGVANNIQFGASNTNNPNSVSSWQSSNFIILEGDGLNKYIFVRYNTPTCTQLVTVANRNCTGTTSTSSTSTTTLSGGCPGTVGIDVVIPLNASQLSVDLSTVLTGSLNYKVKYLGTTVDSASFIKGTNPNIIDLGITLNEAVVYQLFVFASGCGDGIGKDFIWNPSTTSSTTTTTVGTTSSTTTTTFVGTTSSTTTTTVNGCVGSVTINSVVVPNANQLNTGFTSSIGNINWKIKLSGSTLAGGNFPRIGSSQTINLTTITLGAGTIYQLFMFGDGCADGTGFNFVWNPSSTTTSSTTTTTSGAGGCSGVTSQWRYNGVAGSNPLVPYASQADALSAACFGGAGCTGYLNSPTIGQTFYIDKNPNASCTFSGCTTLPTGWYWIYPLSDVDDVYVVHVTSGVIDDVTANHC